MELISIAFIFIGIASWVLTAVSGFVEIALLLSFNGWYYLFGPTVYKASKRIHISENNLRFNITNKLLNGWIIKSSNDRKKYFARKSLLSFNAALRVVVAYDPVNYCLEISVRPCWVSFFLPSFVFFGMFGVTIGRSMTLTDMLKFFSGSILATLLFSLPLWLPNLYWRKKIARKFEKLC